MQLLSLILISTFIYFFKLAEIPNGLYVDEAVTGYNAYSLMLTARDEYAKLLPIAMRFFGSYSPALYTYLTIPIIKLFGLKIISTRFLSALSGVLMTIIIYFFLKNLKLKHKSIPFFGTFLFAITPWSVLLARAGYETYFGFMLFSSGSLFLFLGLKTKKLLAFALAILSLSTYGAHTEIYLVPLFITAILFIFKIKPKIKTLIPAILIQVPNLFLLTTPAFWSKSSLLHKNIFANYVSYLSPRNIFLLGDPDPQRSIPELGSFYSWLFIPWLVGIYYLFKNRKLISYKFIIILLFLTPIPAALGKDSFSTQRALPLLLPSTLIIAIGLDKIFLKIKYSLLLIFPVILFSLLLLWRSYFVFLPKSRATAWTYGHQQLTEIIQNNLDKNFIIDQTRTKPFYIEYAFFSKLNPNTLRNSVDPDIKNNYYSNTQFNSHYKFSNLETRNINWETDLHPNTILVGDHLTFSETQIKEHNLTKMFEITSPVGDTIFIGYHEK